MQCFQGHYATGYFVALLGDIYFFLNQVRIWKRCTHRDIMLFCCPSLYFLIFIFMKNRPLLYLPWKTARLGHNLKKTQPTSFISSLYFVRETITSKRYANGRHKIETAQGICWKFEQLLGGGRQWWLLWGFELTAIELR